MEEKELIPFSDEYDDPCDSCDSNCDHWDAQYCCAYCRWLGQDDCDNCDPMDV